MNPAEEIVAQARRAVAGVTPSALAIARDARRRVDGRLRPDLLDGWTAADLPDQHGRTWAITGATHGIGLEAARAAAAKGARLVVLARSVARAEQLLGSWDSDGRAIACDLSDPESVRAAASEVDEPIDVLLNNAGTFSSQLRYTAEGHELMWATNFLGGFMLTNLIRPRVRRRIVITGSEAHRWARLDLADPDCHARRFIGWSGYSRSKLADLVWAAELSRRLAAVEGAPDVQVAHPGWSATNLQHHQDVGGPGRGQRVADSVTRLSAQSAEAGAWPLLFAATQDLSGIANVGPSTGLRGHPVAGALSGAVLDPHAGRELWAYAARVTKSDLPG